MTGGFVDSEIIDLSYSIRFFICGKQSNEHIHSPYRIQEHSARIKFINQSLNLTALSLKFNLIDH